MCVCVYIHTRTHMPVKGQRTPVGLVPSFHHGMKLRSSGLGALSISLTLILIFDNYNPMDSQCGGTELAKPICSRFVRVWLDSIYVLWEADGLPYLLLHLVQVYEQLYAVMQLERAGIWPPLQRNVHIL